jgi:hypothetical protein
MIVVTVSNPTASRRRGLLRVPGRTLLASGAVVGAVIVGVGGEWLDFRALRVPILLAVGVGVLAAACSFPRRGGIVDSVRTALVGAATWGAGGVLYVIVHLARGESFDASRFGPQWSQALGLIAVHALLLGVPTGIAVAGLMQTYHWRHGQTRRLDTAPIADGA